MVYLYFYELPVYKILRKFRILISHMVKSEFPESERYLLTNQILRSSRSVTANLVEGFGRFHQKENIQFCRLARGSLDETFEHVITAFDEGIITEAILIRVQKEYLNCRKEINYYIKHLSGLKTNNN